MRSGLGEAVLGATVLLEPWTSVDADRSLASNVDDDLLALNVLEHHSEVLRLRLLAAHDAEAMGEREGFRSTAAWFATRTGTSIGHASGDLRLAKALFGGALGATADAVCALAVSIDQAHAIAGAMKGLLPADVV